MGGQKETDKIDGYCECKCRYVMFLVRQDRRTVVRRDRRWGDTDIHTISHRVSLVEVPTPK